MADGIIIKNRDDQSAYFFLAGSLGCKMSDRGLADLELAFPTVPVEDEQYRLMRERYLDAP